MKKNPSKGKKLLIAIISLFITLLLIGIIAFSAIYFSARLDDNAIAVERATLKIVSSDGKEIDPDALNRYVKYEDINTNIINAFVSLEDKRFFKHKGVDYYRLLGATVKNIKSGYFKEGGSTITQQLAKNTQLNSEKTITRKIKEMKLAHDIEKKYSKEEILEMYLNAIYYGNGIYGIDSACKTYFDKSPKDISVSEGAILAGIVKNPSSYSPLANADKSAERMKLVCRLMKEQGYITEKEYDEALKYKYIKPETESVNPYFSAVLSEASEILGLDPKTLIKSEYVITCYYDEKIQNAVQKIGGDPSFVTKTHNGNEALSSVLICDNKTGGIIAAYSSDGINPVTFRRRPGSAIKPIAVYAPALEKNAITEASMFVDEKTDFNGYVPSNYKDIYYGNIDVETAVKNSVNTVAVKIFSDTGKEYCIDKAAQAGITVDKNDMNLSFALGGMTYGTTAKELSEAYMCLSNGGEKQTVGLIKSVKDKSGNIIYNKSDYKKRVFSEETAYIMTDLLQKTAQNGTAKKLSSLPFDVAAKTGTVGGNVDNTDAWCVSYTNDYTVCVWYGGRDNTDGENISVTGGGLPALLSSQIYSKLPITNKNFDVPESVFDAEIDLYAREHTGEIMLANADTPAEYRKNYVFGESNSPTEVSPYFDFSRTFFVAYYAPNGRIGLKFRPQSGYDYRITRRDLSNGEEATVFESTNETDEEMAEMTELYDETTRPHKFYSYTLELMCFGNPLHSQTVTIIT